MTEWTAEELAAKLADNPDLEVADPLAPTLSPEQLKAAIDRARAIVMAKMPKPSKYHNRRTGYNGRWYDSHREAVYAEQLDLRVKAGEVLWWLPQVPIPIPGHATYRADFLEVWADGSVHVIDIKGVRTAMYKLKKKQVEERYPINIEER